jgi:hypothetical protein
LPWGANPLAAGIRMYYEQGVRGITRWIKIGLLTGCMGPLPALSQIDPIPRELIQVGYNASFEGHAPLSAYGFYYLNVPDFLKNTNLTLRLAVAPVYVDSELGISRVLGENTDLGIGLAGGGFADSYDEIRRGTFHQSESFTGHGGEGSVSLYHLFNPGQLIPLNGVLRGTARYSTYQRDDNTAPTFELPKDRETFSIRTGLRWGGKEPLLFPSLAMELSAWYEGDFRHGIGGYGFNNDRSVEKFSQLAWMQALLAYTMTNSGQSFYISIVGGTTIDPDRFSSYRLGSLLPLVSEFPLTLPGYYYQEISAKSFVLLGGNYIIPLTPDRRWSLNFTATTAGVEYLHGLEQPGYWHSGVGGGLLYQSKSVKIMIGYAYGIDAMRTHGRGANSVGILLQYDLGHVKQTLLNPYDQNRWRGFQRVLGGFTD